MTEVELERRRIEERGFWKEMEERGLSRLDALFCDEHYERRIEIRRGLITVADKERQERRARDFLVGLRREEEALWQEAQREFETEAEARPDPGSESDEDRDVSM